jgi:transcriptional regulator with XRE-family HTH domain
MSTGLDIEVRAALQARRGDWPRIAAKCAVSHSWVSKFVRGQIENPGYATLVRLHHELVGTNGARPVPQVAEEVRDAA